MYCLFLSNAFKYLYILYYFIAFMVKDFFEIDLIKIDFVEVRNDWLMSLTEHIVKISQQLSSFLYI